jgi:hypothetical protein
MAVETGRQLRQPTIYMKGIKRALLVMAFSKIARELKEAAN